MEHSLKETILMGRSRERGCSHGQTGALIREISMKIIYMGGECITGQMEGFTMGHGNATKCMDMVFLRGLMGGNMRENMLMTRNKERECSSGLMEENILAVG